MAFLVNANVVLVCLGLASVGLIGTKNNYMMGSRLWCWHSQQCFRISRTWENLGYQHELILQVSESSHRNVKTTASARHGRRLWSYLGWRHAGQVVSWIITFQLSVNMVSLDRCLKKANETKVSVEDDSWLYQKMRIYCMQILTPPNKAGERLCGILLGSRALPKQVYCLLGTGRDSAYYTRVTRYSSKHNALRSPVLYFETLVNLLSISLFWKAPSTVTFRDLFLLYCPPLLTFATAIKKFKYLSRYTLQQIYILRVSHWLLELRARYKAKNI